MNGAIEKAKEIQASEPEKYILLQQFENWLTRKFTLKQRVLKSSKQWMVKSTFS